MLRVGVFVISFLFGAAAVCPDLSAALPPDSSIRYRVVLSDPARRMLHVTCDVEQHEKRPLAFSFPSWSPGSYTFRPISKFILNLEVRNTDRPVPFKEIRTDTYETMEARAGRFTIQYDVDLSANNRSLDKSFIGNEIALIKGDFTFCCVTGFRDVPVRLDVEAPPGWELCSSLMNERRDGGLTAKGYDDLIDGTIMLGKFDRASTISGTTEFVVASDPTLGVAPSSLIPFVKALADYQIKLFGSAPFKSYTFFLHVIGESSYNSYPGGVVAIEHRYGTTISFTPQAARVFTGRDLTNTIEKVFAHELFHAWNGRRIGPAELARPNLNEPVQSRNIWFIEGVTRYYDIISRQRVSTDDPSQLYQQLSELVPAASVNASLEQKSLDSWQGLSPVLYNKGCLVALALDMKIRWMTDNRKSLDDVMRYLYQEIDNGAAHYTAESLRRMVIKASGVDLNDVFDRFVTGSETLDVGEFLGYAGLNVSAGTRRVPQDLGIFFDKSNSQVVGVLRNGAGETAGLRPRDKLLTVNGKTLLARPFEEAFRSDEIGAAYDLSILRGDKELTLRLTINAVEETEVNITERSQVTEKQLRIRETLVNGGRSAATTAPSKTARSNRPNRASPMRIRLVPLPPGVASAVLPRQLL